MAKFKLKVSKEGVKSGQESGDFEYAPPGVYVVELAAVEEKKKDGGEYPYLETRWKIIGEGREGKKLEKRYSNVWDNVSLSPAAEWKLFQFLSGLGIKVNARGEMSAELEFDPSKPGTVIGTKAIARLKRDQDQNGDYRPKLGSLSPVNPEELDDSLGEDDVDDEDEDEEEATNPFDDEGDDEGGDDDLYTEASLSELDNKELSAVLPEFDLDANDLKVKTKAGKLNVEKTRAKMIAAILEAQNGTEEDSADEDPF